MQLIKRRRWHREYYGGGGRCILNQENLSLREAEEREGRKPQGGGSVVQWESQTPPRCCDRCECTAQIGIRTQTLIPRFGEGCLKTVLMLTCWEPSQRGVPPCLRSRLLLGAASVLGRATQRLPLTQPPPPALDTSQGHPTLAPLGAA